MRADSEFEALVSELLKSGVSPRYVSRLARELEDHITDLEEEACRFGVPADEAPRDALDRLGAPAAIAGEFAKRPELYGWIHRCGWINSLLHVFLSACLALMLPWHIVLASHATLLRYGAAAAGGSSITAGILLVMTLLLSPEHTAGASDAAAAVGSHPVLSIRRGPMGVVTREPTRRQLSEAKTPFAQERTLLPLLSAPVEQSAGWPGFNGGSQVRSLLSSPALRKTAGESAAKHLAGDAVSGD